MDMDMAWYDPAHSWKSEDNYLESGLSCLHMYSWDWAQLIWIAKQMLLPAKVSFQLSQVLKVLYYLCLGVELGPLCWPVQAAGLTIFSLFHQFAEYTSQV